MKPWTQTRRAQRHLQPRSRPRRPPQPASRTAMLYDRPTRSTRGHESGSLPTHSPAPHLRLSYPLTDSSTGTPSPRHLPPSHLCHTPTHLPRRRPTPHLSTAPTLSTGTGNTIHPPETSIHSSIPASRIWERRQANRESKSSTNALGRRRNTAGAFHR